MVQRDWEGGPLGEVAAAAVAAVQVRESEEGIGGHCQRRQDEIGLGRWSGWLVLDLADV